MRRKFSRNSCLRGHRDTQRAVLPLRRLCVMLRLTFATAAGMPPEIQTEFRAHLGSRLAAWRRHSPTVSNMAAVPFLRRDSEVIDLGSTAVNTSRQLSSRQVFAEKRARTSISSIIREWWTVVPAAESIHVGASIRQNEQRTNR